MRVILGRLNYVLVFEGIRRDDGFFIGRGIGAPGILRFVLLIHPAVDAAVLVQLFLDHEDVIFLEGGIVLVVVERPSQPQLVLPGDCLSKSLLGRYEMLVCDRYLVAVQASELDLVVPFSVFVVLAEQ